MSQPPASSQEADRLKPTRIFRVVTHGAFAKGIKVLDITDRITAPYNSDEFTKVLKKMPKSDLPGPWLTVTRGRHWWSKSFVAESPSDHRKIAEWKGGFSSLSNNTLKFPPDSPHSSHPITMMVKSYWTFKEQFVVDSATYTWKSDHWPNLKFNLYKSIGSHQVQVGRYEQKFKVLRTGGILVLDTSEIDDVVGVLTCLVVLRKRRQKEAERQNP